MTNRAIAAEMFISPKTVDTNLTRVYRKLGIHSPNATWALGVRQSELTPYNVWR